MNNETVTSWYENRRNELLNLLKKTIALDLPEKYAEELRGIFSKCQESAFGIALVGQSRGGKSTTFNALCDGHEISPRGNGANKTSAIAVTVQNISTEETGPSSGRNTLREWVEVEYKNEREIVMSLAKLLHPVIKNNEELAQRLRISCRGLKDDDFNDLFDFSDNFSSLVEMDNPEQRDILKTAVNSIWKMYEADRLRFGQDDEQGDEEPSDKLDSLYIATLLLRFYGTPELSAMQSQTMITIQDFQRRSVFPKDWYDRWNIQGQNAEFSLDEVAFIFIRSALVRLHSRNLQRLGCRITDCPGLFANHFDTMVAERAMLTSDAVWYLFPGDKELGGKDLKALQKIGGKISRMGMAGKTVVTANLRSKDKTRAGNVIGKSNVWINRVGFDNDSIPYNACLALLAMQGDLLLNHPENFSEQDAARLQFEAEERDIESPDASGQWSALVATFARCIKGEEPGLRSLQEDRTLDADAVATVRQCSYIDDILKRLEEEIIPLKARSILIDTGSSRASAALKEYEGKLEAMEENAAKTDQEWKDQIESERNQLEIFLKEAEEFIKTSPLWNDEKKHRLTSMISEKIISIAIDSQFCQRCAEDVVTIMDEVGKKWFWTDAGVQEAMKDALHPLITTSLRGALTRGLTKWQKMEDNSLYLAVNTICIRIKQLWAKEISSISILKGVSSPEISDEEMKTLIQKLSEVLFSNEKLAEIANLKRMQLVTFLWGKAVSLFKKDKKEMDIEQKKQEIAKVMPLVEDEMKKGSFRETLERTLIGMIQEGIIRQIGGRILVLLADMKKTFVQRVKDFEEGRTAFENERNLLLAENKRIREQVIKPLREQIEAFQEKVQREFDGYEKMRKEVVQ